MNFVEIGLALFLFYNTKTFFCCVQAMSLIFLLTADEDKTMYKKTTKMVV
jgi:hypothetical protein